MKVVFVLTIAIVFVAEGRWKHPKKHPWGHHRGYGYGSYISGFGGYSRGYNGADGGGYGDNGYYLRSYRGYAGESDDIGYGGRYSGYGYYFGGRGGYGGNGGYSRYGGYGRKFHWQYDRCKCMKKCPKGKFYIGKCKICRKCKLVICCTWRRRKFGLG